MTKPKLTDAVKQPSATLPETAPTPAAAADTGSGGAASLPPASGKDKGGDDPGDEGNDDPESSAGSSDKPTDPPAPARAAAAAEPAPAAGKTLAEYKAAFGDVQGCVYFAEGMDFTTAATKHIEVQGKQITDLKSANETLTTQAAALAKEVGGEKDPLKTGNEAAKGGNKSAIDEYASVLESKLEKLK